MQSYMTQSQAWQPEFDEGRHSRARLGFILMATDLAAEADFYDMTPKDVGIHITRLKSDDYTTNDTLMRHIETMAQAAARLQPDAKPHLISYTCTSGSMVIGIQKVMAEIKKGAPWAQPMCLGQAILDALKALNIKKLVLGTPYLDEITQMEVNFLHENGYELVNVQGLNLATGWQMGRVTPNYWREFALSIDRSEADAIFLSCSGIRALEVAQAIEDETGKPVITSNQAHFWSCLRRVGIDDTLQGFGRLFSYSSQSFMDVL